jgi:hypothetical protein
MPVRCGVRHAAGRGQAGGGARVARRPAQALLRLPLHVGEPSTLHAAAALASARASLRGAQALAPVADRSSALAQRVLHATARR